MKTIGILGEGAWGTALANLCADNGFTVYLWCYDQAVKKSIQNNHSNQRYLPGVATHSLVIPTTELQDVFTHCRWIIETTPVQYLRSVIEKCVPYVCPGHIWVIASKGIENDTLLFPTQIIDDVLPFQPKKIVAVGPSFAQEVAQRIVTALDIAACDYQDGVALQHMLANAYFYPYIHNDIIGAQVGATVKNIIALGMGMLHGAGYKDNTKAFFLTHCLQEASQLVVALGGQEKTIYGLSGIGDIVLSAMSSQSRNRQVGEYIGKGRTLEDILLQTGYIPEGINSAKSMYQLIQKRNLNLPVCKGIYEVLFEGKPIELLIEFLTVFLLKSCDQITNNS